MFNPDFYPTPEAVILQMLEGHTIENKTILEPSAGKGNIVDFLLSNGVKEVLTCETNRDLAKILQSKSTFIEADFLTLTSERISHIDLIVMNPPFSADEKHLLHAWEIAPAGCEIISLVNNNTIKNPFSSERKQLSALIDEHGESLNLGDCFQDSERKTSVEVGLVKLRKPGGSYNQEFEGFFMGEDEPEEQATGLMPYNVVRDLVNRYVEAVKLYDKQLELGVQMNALTSGFYGSSHGISITEDGKPKAREAFKKDLQKSGWNWIFGKMNMAKFTTQGLREDINNFVEKQHQIPFTMKNIYHMIDIVIQTTEQRMDKAIIEVFDSVTKHYDDNRYNVEGWKTNSHYLLNQKIIFPYMCPQDKWHDGDKIDNTYGSTFQKVEDMVKAICYVLGENWDKYGNLADHIRYPYKLYYSDTVKYFSANERGQGYGPSLNQTIENLGDTPYDLQRSEPVYGEQFEWSFFKIRMYKKGTAHFVFKDPDVWAKFNQRIAKIKGYPLFESNERTREKNEKRGHKEGPKVKPIILGSFKVA